MPSVSETQAQIAAQAPIARQKGEDWFQKLSPELEQKFPTGTLVAIHVESGQYVTAQTQLELVDEYEKRFGKEIGWVREIDKGKKSRAR